MDLPGLLIRTAATAATQVARVVAPSGPGPGFGAILAAIGLPGDSAEGDGRQADAPSGKTLPDREPVDPVAVPGGPIVPPLPFVAVADPVAPPTAAGPRARPGPPVPDRTPTTPPAAAAVARPAPVAVAGDPQRIAAVPSPADTTPAMTDGAPIPVDTAPKPAEPPPADPTPVAHRPRIAGEVLAPRITIAPTAVEWRPVADKATDPKRREPDPFGIAGLSSADTAAPRAIAAAAAPDRGALDTQDDGWMQGMIDRIETLRDAGGGVGQTRIRLSPDALGGVEISIRTTDDGVQLRFASDHPDAARLLADAQPRLAELAEARGLKLGGMQVDVGQQQQSRRDPPAQDPPARFTRPAPSDVPADPVHDDIRIA